MENQLIKTNSAKLRVHGGKFIFDRDAIPFPVNERVEAAGVRGAKQKRSEGKQPGRKSRPFKATTTIGHGVACQLNFIMIIESAPLAADLQDAASRREGRLSLPPPSQPASINAPGNEL